MHINQLIGAAFVATGFMTSPVWAEVYACTITSQDNGYWIAPEILLQHTSGETVAVVYDGFIAEFVGEPIEARVSRENSNVTIFVWSLLAKSGSNQTSNLRYSASIRKSDQTIRAQMTPRGLRRDLFGPGHLRNSGRRQLIPLAGVGVPQTAPGVQAKV